MTPAGFVATYGGAADRAAAATGLSRWTILAQWGLETGWCAADSGCPWSNLAGITCHGGCPCNAAGFCRYSDPSGFADDYSAVLHNGLYPGVLGSAGTTVRTQLRALGQSPWAGSHYDSGGGPGSSLMDLYAALIQPLSGIGLDDAFGPQPVQPPPVPVPPPPPPPPPVLPPVAAGSGAAAALLLLGAGVAAIAYAEHRRPGTAARLWHDLVDLLRRGEAEAVQLRHLVGV